jgi:RNA polymerase sigma-70 factor (ECF subfamily)
MDLDTYRRLRTEARRHARRAQDADDLVQDALLIALEHAVEHPGREHPGGEHPDREHPARDDPAWLIGVIRHRAAMDARSAIRRRRREAAIAHDEATRASQPEHEPTPAPSPAALLARLPPSARRVAALALHGLNAEEIRWILGIADTAFRQRLTTIRKAIGALPAPQRGEAIALAYVRDPARSVDLQFGLVRRALKAALRGASSREPPGLGTHDADGHLIVVRGRAHTWPRGGNE